MYQKYLEQLNIKPEFNVKWDYNNGKYSDGEVEDEIIDILASNEEEDYDSAILKHFSWPTLYHLTPLRKNILSWYPFDADGEILEIGCGLGSITNMLCDKCKHVTSVELSRRRAAATLIRCRNRENLEIIVGNLNDIPFTKRFDYITLIGVLEYQGKYTDSANPYVDFLKKIGDLLKPDGKLLVAIENKFGLKYWCGAREDHTGVPFDGLNHYLFGNKMAKTFSKKELGDIICKAGFVNQNLYYPFPDYKFPTVIFSEKEDITVEKMGNVMPYYIPDANTLVANEKSLYPDLIENRVLDFFANSFLVECSRSEVSLGKVTYALMNNTRKKGLNIGTSFGDNGKVYKWNNEPGNTKHIQDIADNLRMLRENGCEVVDFEIRNGELVTPKILADTYEEVLVKAYKERKYDQIYKLFDRLILEYKKSSPMVSKEENILCQVFDKEEILEINFGDIAQTGFIDMIARNAFYCGGKIIWIDQEWIINNVPISYIFYRMINEMYFTFPWMQNTISKRELFDTYDIFGKERYFEALDMILADNVLNRNVIRANQVFSRVNYDFMFNNVKKLLGLTEENSSEEIISSINVLLKEKRYLDLVKIFEGITGDDIKDFKLKMFIKWVNHHSIEICSNTCEIVSNCSDFESAVDKILSII